jgi:SAM-dependent methyltransferase
VWLAEHGHRPTLLDLSPNFIEMARQQVAASPASSRVEAVMEGDARDLSRFGDGSFDAALCLGPMYHLQAERDRRAVAGELNRVLAPGATAYVAWMPRLLFLRRSIVVPEERRHLLDEAFVRAVVDEGRFDNDVPSRFDNGYGASPDEIEPFMDTAGFDTVELLAAESFAAGGIGDYVAELAEQEPEILPRLLDLLSEHAADPGLLAGANHLLWIGRKRPG